MTVAQSTRQSGPFTATEGQTVFNYDFPVKAASELTVLRLRDGAEAPLELDVDYGVTNVGSDTGTIILTAGSTAGDIITIKGELPIARTSNFAGWRSIPDNAINDELDRMTKSLQEMRRDVDVSIKPVQAGEAYDIQGLRLTHVAGGIANDDAATLGQLKPFADAAAASANAAATSQGNAAASEESAAEHDTAAAASAALAAAAASVANKLVISPFQFGGVGDGVADDADALNAAFDAVRTQATASSKNMTQTILDLSGGVWRTTESINATGIVSWNLQVRGGTIVGECAGKAVLDLCGSRGYELHGVAVWGDKANMPACAWQAARTTLVGFCDNASFFDCSTAGYFSRAAIHEYGQETALHVHGTYFNYHHDARVAIFEGYDENGLASDFATVVTGAVSHISNKLLNCDFRYLPADDNVAVITGVSNAADGVITTQGHAFAVGNEVVFFDVGGMTNMRYVIATVVAVSGDSFTIDTNTTSFGAYTSGGVAIRKQTKASVYYSRGAGMNFSDSYIVAWGQPQLEIGFPDASFLSYSELDLDILFEGAACPSNVLFSAKNQAVSVIGSRLKTYQADPINALMDIDDGTGAVSLYGLIVECVSTKHTIPLIPAADRSRLAIVGGKILWTGIANVDYANYALFTGVITDIATGLDTYIGPKFADKRDGSWTPIITSLIGSITTVGTKTCKVNYLGKWAYISIDVTITTNGTGAGQVQVSLPFTIGDAAVISGKEQAVTGKMLTGICLSGLTSCAVLNYDNTYPAANGTRLILSGWVPVA